MSTNVYKVYNNALQKTSAFKTKKNDDDDDDDNDDRETIEMPRNRLLCFALRCLRPKGGKEGG